MCCIALKLIFLCLNMLLADRNKSWIDEFLLLLCRNELTRYCVCFWFLERIRRISHQLVRALFHFFSSLSATNLHFMPFFFGILHTQPLRLEIKVMLRFGPLVNLNLSFKVPDWFFFPAYMFWSAQVSSKIRKSQICRSPSNRTMVIWIHLSIALCWVILRVFFFWFRKH